MKYVRQYAAALILILILTLTGCSPEQEQERFDAFLWEIFTDSVTSDTLSLHYTLEDPEAFGVESPEVTWGEVDFSEQAMAEDQKEMEEMQKLLKGFRYRQLTQEQQLIYDILSKKLETELQFYEWLDFYEPFAYISGLQSNLPINLSAYRFNNESDVEDYLQLLIELPEYMQAFLDFERDKAENGFFMSQANAEEVIRQCREWIQNPQENMLIETFEERLEALEGLDEKQKEQYCETNRKAVLEMVIPCYEAIIETFEELKTSGENELGLAQYERGKEYYQYLLSTEVGTDRSADEVVQLLDGALEDAFDELIQAANENMEAYLAYIQEENVYEDFEPAETIRYLEKSFADRFPALPEIQYTLSPVHESLENSVSPAFYMLPAIDAYEKNAIYINDPDGSAGSFWALLAHEGIPGHMYQNVFFWSQQPNPVRKFLDSTGYDEGWATYVEMMSYDEYEYENDLYAQLERIEAELNLLISARIDIGVNYEGWDVADTEGFMEDLGLSADSAEAIVNYVIAEPANYQIYCVGWLEFEELREYAESELGAAFDEKEFHEVLLKTGSCPFSILRGQVEAYVKEAK